MNVGLALCMNHCMVRKLSGCVGMVKLHLKLVDFMPRIVASQACYLSSL